MPNSWLDRSLIAAIQKMADPVPIRLRLGPAADSSPSSPSALPTIRVSDRRALFALLRNPGINFGELYSQGRLEVEGDLLRLLESLYHIRQGIVARTASRWYGWMQINSMQGSRKNIHHHYDISNEFYQMWLDAELVYTCAYFPHEKASLEEAQKAKMDHVSRKVWLRPGETVVEAGCGWGALALHMARHYGVRVKAFNISHEQIAFARERARREGLSARVEFIEDDCRNIDGRFDVFVSVGMLEHLGAKNYLEFGRVIRRTIGGSGRGLLHFIGRNYPKAFSVWMRKRIFPGAYAPSLQEAMNVLQPQDYSVLHLENLRAHYAKTLEHWLSRFEESYQAVVEKFGPRFARMWRLYLAGSIAAFRVGGLQLFQVVFAGNKCTSRPLTWSNLYTGAEEPVQEKKWIHAIS